MNIWIFNHYADTPDRQSTRSYDLARQLVERGYQVTIFAAGFSHYKFTEERVPPGKQWKEEDWNGVRFMWLKTFPYRGNDWRRVLNMLSYGWRAFLLGRQLSAKPDVIIGTHVHPVAAVAGYLLSKVKKSRFIFEVTDLWPETLIDIGALTPHHPLVFLLRIWEKFLYQRAEKTIMLWPQAHRYTTKLGIAEDKIVWIPHGVDLSRLHAMKPYDGGLLPTFTVMFLGGQSKYHGIDTILEAAGILLNPDNGRVRFVIVGGGAEGGRLHSQAAKMRLSNVEFRSMVPKSEIGKVMGEADAFIFHIRKLIVLQKYGISANKLYDYLSSGRPVIFAVDSSNNPVEEAQAGISVPAENPRALAEAVMCLSRLPPEERLRMGQNGIAFVEQNHDIRVLANRLEGILSDSGSSRLGRPTRVKRVLDLLVSTAGLVILAPFLIFAAALVKWDSTGPVFYRGLRVGRFERPFRIFKFRTMVQNADRIGASSTPEDDARVTWAGRFLRKHKLDELPQLLNVIKGEMSLVGPRPQIPWAVELYTADEKAVLSVRPGITDPASLRFRNEGEILRGSANPDQEYLEKIHPEKMRLSLEYIRKQSFWLDCQILVNTLAVVLFRPPQNRSGVERDGAKARETISQ